jgi:tetratricopeptide (TPR) repeat protein
MNFCLSRERLEQILADPGQVSAEECQAFESHSETCPACREVVEQFLHDAETAKWRQLLGSEALPAAAEDAEEGEPTSPARQAVPISYPFPPSTLAGYLGQLGHYHLLKRLGGGAMGTVFLAYDARMRRQVALKVPRPDLAESDRFRDRFEREARAAAAVHHEHVVTTYHVANSPGFPLPYLVMEYIEGETLADRLQRQPGLPPREAAVIARQVALGLAAAQTQGLLHRDIKPSNILLEGSSGRARLTDFGLARAIDGAEQISNTGAFVGTPAYMSPEQIESPKRVGKPSDLFSLGIVLYEMLTGARPFCGMTNAMVMQQIVHAEPIAPRKLNAAIGRDLETIVLKCLAKEPAHRYQTASELADDLQRWLAGAPIQARPVGALGKFWRWCRREPGLATASGFAAAALVAATAVSLLFAFHKAKRAEEARSATKFLIGLLEASEPVGIGNFPFGNTVGKGRHLGLREFLDGDAYQRVTDSLKDQPDVQAMLMDTIGNLYRSLARYPEAKRMLQSSREIRQKTLGDKHPDVAISVYYLAWLYHDQGYHDEADQLFQEALAIRSMDNEDPLVISIKFNRAWLLADMEEYAAAEQLFRDVLENCRQRQEREPRDVAIASIGLALILGEQERYAEVGPLITEATAIFEKQEGGRNIAKLISLTVGALIARASSNYESAVKSLQEGVQIGRLSLGEQHPYLTIVLSELALTLEKMGKDDEAERYHRECLAIASRTKEYEHQRIGQQTRCLAVLLARKGRYSEGERLFEDLLEKRRQQFGDDHRLTAETLADYGRFVTDCGDKDKAAQVLRRALDIFKRNPRRFTKFYELCLNNLGAILIKKGEYAEGESLLRESLPLMEKRLGKNYRKPTARPLKDLGWALIRLGKPRDGEIVLREAVSPRDWDIYPEPPQDMVARAAIYSLAAEEVIQDNKLSQLERSKLAQKYTGLAVELLTRAQARGFFNNPANIEQLKRNPDFKLLGQREDFQKLRRELERKSTP